MQAKVALGHCLLALLVLHTFGSPYSDFQLEGNIGLSNETKISVSGLSSGADFAGQFLVAYSSTVIGAGIFAGQPYMCAVTKFPKSNVSKECQDPDQKKGGEKDEVPRCADFCIGCKEGEVLAYDQCKRPDPSIVEVNLLKPSVEKNAKAGLIDGLGNLSKRRVYLNHGKQDRDYLDGSVKNTANFFRLFMDKPEEQVVYEGKIDSGHAYPVPGDQPWTCGFGQIFGLVDMPVQNCDFDGPGRALSHIYEGVRNLTSPDKHRKEAKEWEAMVKEASEHMDRTAMTGLKGHHLDMVTRHELDKQLKHKVDEFKYPGLRWFDQTSFMGANNEPMFADRGLIYVPIDCALGRAKCDLHINFPGCGFVEDVIFLTLAVSLNLNDWGSANNIVILYPRVNGEGATKDQRNGCWNVYGKTGENYATKEASQMAAVKSMIDAAMRGKLGDAAKGAVSTSAKKKVFLLIICIVVLCLLCIIVMLCCQSSKVADDGSSQPLKDNTVTPDEVTSCKCCA